MAATKDWFTVDKRGLSQLVGRRGKGFVVAELLQNSWPPDEKSTVVTVTLEAVPMRSYARLVVEDDDPDGFTDLRHAFTLFAPSEKKADPTKRGRFNLGEKLVLSLCESATIVSTRGGVAFSAGGREMLRERRAHGTRFEAVLPMTRDEMSEVERYVGTLIPPDGVSTTFNGIELVHRTPAQTIDATLPTEFANEDGEMRRTTRKTKVRLYEVRFGETASVYEMGVPVVELDGHWHADVLQKVPLNFERDAVTPAFQRALRTAILDGSYREITYEDTTSGWVKEALPFAGREAIAAVIQKRFGDKVVIDDNSDPEGTKIAISEDYKVVGGGTFSKGEWDAIKGVGRDYAPLMLPAGQVTPSPKVLCGPEGIPPLPDEKLTPGMRRVMDYATRFGREVLGFEPTVNVSSMMNGKAAWYGGRTLTFNLMGLGHAFFNQPDQADVDALLIHEFSHDAVPDHLSEGFHRETCRIGAKLHRVRVPFLDAVPA